MSGDQSQLFNVDTKDINPDWIDPKQPLRIPVNPLHFKAHKLQILLEILEKQAAGRAAQQFNSKNYIEALNEFTRVVVNINLGKTEDTAEDDDKLEDQLQSLSEHNAGRLAKAGNSGSESAVGPGASPGLDSGISADNPFAGLGLPGVQSVPLSEGVSVLPGSVPDNQ